MLNAVESLRDAKLVLLKHERVVQIVQTHVTVRRALMLALLELFSSCQAGKTGFASGADAFDGGWKG